MLNFSHQTRVFLCATPVDMRKSFRGLCQVAESLLQQDPTCGHWFVFLNRRADRMKLLGWDGRGFWIWYMYLEAGTFQWPDRDDDAQHLEIDVTQLSLIINGIDLQSAKRRVRYRQNVRQAVTSVN
ncbi:MAG: IS66 family insertion sequence element accessory protein TnpB [Planctomycetaceae bacterium]